MPEPTTGTSTPEGDRKLPPDALAGLAPKPPGFDPETAIAGDLDDETAIKLVLQHLAEGAEEKDPLQEYRFHPPLISPGGPGRNCAACHPIQPWVYSPPKPKSMPTSPPNFGDALNFLTGGWAGQPTGGDWLDQNYSGGQRIPGTAGQTINAGAEVGASFVPGPGELMDLEVIGNSNYPLWQRRLAVLSLGVSAVTYGLSPNAGAFLRNSDELATMLPRLGPDAARSVDAVLENGGRLPNNAQRSTRIASGIGGEILPAVTVRTIKKGEKIDDLIQELAEATYKSGGVEHAIVSLKDGTRVIVKGGPGGIEFGADVKRVILHTHPTTTGPSQIDFDMLDTLGQQSSFVYELFGGGLTKFSKKRK